MKNTNLNIDLKSLLQKSKKGQKLLIEHLVFASIMVVLLVYVFVVIKINQFATATPSETAQATASAQSSVPRLNSKSIQQIQSLEQTNTQTKSLFEQARNNPFQE